MYNNNIRKMVQTSLLTALAIIIPIYFGFLSIKIPPFTATIAAHVPMFLAMFLGPAAAAFVGFGSAVGFQLAGMPSYVVARAAMHIIVGALGAYLLRKGMSYTKTAALTAPVHGILEGLVIIPFQGFTVYNYIVAGGTMAHHTVDAIIAFALVGALAKAGTREFMLSKQN